MFNCEHLVPKLKRIAIFNVELAKKIDKQGGFVCPDDLAKLIEVDRLMMILVRCGAGRFICPAQDVQHFMDIIAEHSKMKEAATGKPMEGDYVRDVSIPVWPILTKGEYNTVLPP